MHAVGGCAVSKTASEEHLPAPPPPSPANAKIIDGTGSESFEFDYANEESSVSRVASLTVSSVTDLCLLCQVRPHFEQSLYVPPCCLAQRPGKNVSSYHHIIIIIILCNINVTANNLFLLCRHQELRVEMNVTSQFIRDVICELLLRDTEYLLDRYMRKMRKSFSRMYWDDEVGEEK